MTIWSDSSSKSATPSSSSSRSGAPPLSGRGPAGRHFCSTCGAPALPFVRVRPVAQAISRRRAVGLRTIGRYNPTPGRICRRRRRPACRSGCPTAPQPFLAQHGATRSLHQQPAVLCRLRAQPCPSFQRQAVEVVLRPPSIEPQPVALAPLPQVAVQAPPEELPLQSTVERWTQNSAGDGASVFFG